MNNELIIFGGALLIFILLSILIMRLRKPKNKGKPAPSLSFSDVYGNGIIKIMNELPENHLKKLYQEALKIRYSSLTEIIEPEIKPKESEPKVEKNKGINVKVALLNYMFGEGKMDKKVVYDYCTGKLGLSIKDTNSLVNQLINEGRIYDSGKGTLKSTE